MPEDTLRTSQVSELLHAALHEIAGSAGQIHRIAALLERRGDSLDEDARTWLSHLGRSTERLNESLQAIRRYNEAIELPNNPATFPLQRAVNGAAALAAATNVTAPELPEVHADPRRVELVLRELLANATKFTADRPPGIHISTARKGADVVVSIADNGIGIDPAQNERIFQPFVRLWGDRFRGAGMGLAIARTMIESWGGRIWAEPAAPAGSVFRFTIPAA
jgi:signal transduction histidine kinase